MPYSVYFIYEHRVTVDADSEEEAIKKAMDVPLDYNELYYTEECEVEKWDWEDKETKEVE